MRVLRSTLCDDKIKPRHSIPQAPVQARTFGKTKRRSPKNQVRFPDEVNSFCIKLLKQDPGKRIPALPVVSKHVQKGLKPGKIGFFLIHFIVLQVAVVVPESLTAERELKHSKRIYSTSVQIPRAMSSHSYKRPLQSRTAKGPEGIGDTTAR